MWLYGPDSRSFPLPRIENNWEPLNQSIQCDQFLQSIENWQMDYMRTDPCPTHRANQIGHLAMSDWYLTADLMVESMESLKLGRLIICT